MAASGKVKPRQQPESIKLLGGAPCLDFANSVDWTDRGEPLDEASDALLEPGQLARWGRRRLGGRSLPAVAADELVAARALRAAIYRTFAALADGGSPAATDLQLIASTHAEGVAHGRLRRVDHAWRLSWAQSDSRRVRFAVAADAVRLLEDPGRLRRLRRCPGRHCGWLFIDSSGRRRWCSMDSCGSREKMRRLYARQRAVRSGVR